MDWKDALTKEFDAGVLGYMAKGVTSGGYPMNDGSFTSWSDWLIGRIEVRMKQERENQLENPSKNGGKA